MRNPAGTAGRVVSFPRCRGPPRNADVQETTELERKLADVKLDSNKLSILNISRWRLDVSFSIFAGRPEC